LLTDAIATATAAGADRLFLEVRPSNVAAVRMYERAGFTHVRRRRRYYEDGEDADVMALTLKPEPEQGGESGRQRTPRTRWS
jgi:ribosomal-protein-alanine N-acetyltransferase